MKIETSETIDLLLHAYALGSRYDGTSLIVLVFLSAIVSLVYFHFLYITDVRNKDKSIGNSAMDTVAIRNMLRRTSSDDTQSTSYGDDDDSTTVDTTRKKSVFSRSRPCAKNGGNRQQEVVMAQRQPPSPVEESDTT